MDGCSSIRVETAKNMDYDTANEANNLLRNGILVETSKGLICMSLNDALSSDLNLSVEDLRNVAAELISQQNTVFKKDININCDSDGFSSECSDFSTTSASSVQSTFLTFSSLTNDIHSGILTCENVLNRPKLVSIGPLALHLKSEHESSNSVAIDNKEGINSTMVKNDAKNTVIASICNPVITVKPVEAPVEASVNNTAEPSKPKKGRGGWPKGRKRKPELLNLPPKAPSTGYTLYLNEQRKLFKNSSLAFHEITKIIGNKWSSLSLEEKKPYLGKAEEDKKRYREELKQYRQSDAYRQYLAQKRKKRLQNNVLSESDMDATDEIDEEDNEELYCRTCDQWFNSLHNKREHLQGKQHLQSVAGDMNKELGSDIEGLGTSAVFSTSLDESSLDATPLTSVSASSKTGPISSVLDSMTNLISLVSKREQEIKVLEQKQQENVSLQQTLCKQLFLLNEKHNKLKKDILKMKEKEKDMENHVFHLWQVPSYFIITDFNTDSTSEFNDGTE